MSRILPLMLLCSCLLSKNRVPEEFSTCDGDNGFNVSIGAMDSASPPVSVEGDTLSVDVRYGGGCGEHVFSICWPDANFLESDPVQVPLEIWHGGDRDTCLAFLGETLTFDLSPLKAAYKDAYGDGPGTMMLDISGAPEQVEYTFD